MFPVFTVSILLNLKIKYKTIINFINYFKFNYVVWVNYNNEKDIESYNYEKDDVKGN